MAEEGGGLELNSAKWVECLIGVGGVGVNFFVSHDLALLIYIFTVYLHRDQHKIDILEREIYKINQYFNIFNRFYVGTVVFFCLLSSVI